MSIPLSNTNFTQGFLSETFVICCRLFISLYTFTKSVTKINVKIFLHYYYILICLYLICTCVRKDRGPKRDGRNKNSLLINYETQAACRAPGAPENRYDVHHQTIQTRLGLRQRLTIWGKHLMKSGRHNEPGNTSVNIQ